MRGARWLVPPRRRGVEHLDAPGVDPRLVARSLRDVARANTLFGGTRAVLRELGRVLPTVAGTSEASLLDVGTGAGDIAAAAARAAARRGIRLRTIGVDIVALTGEGRPRTDAVVQGNAVALPFGTASVDLVVCSQLLHHFADDHAHALLRELDRVARHRVIVSDLRRHRVAAAGIWFASFALRFHPVSRHDGVMSVLRGFTREELEGLVRGAVGVSPDVRGHLGFRVTASWTPARPVAAVTAAATSVGASIAGTAA